MQNTKNAFTRLLCATTALLLSALATADTLSTMPLPRGVSYEWMSLSRWFEMHAEDIALAEAGEAPLVFIGDSITEGWEHAGAEQWQKHFLPRGAVDFGIGGDITGNLLWRLDNGAASNLDPRAVVLLIGINNNWFTEDPPATIADGIEAVVDKLQAVYANADILLLGVFPAGEMPDDPQRAAVAAINRDIQPLGERERVTYLDIGRKFLQDDGRIAADIMPDFLHLSPEGYRIWAEAIAPWVDERVPAKDG